MYLDLLLWELILKVFSTKESWEHQEIHILWYNLVNMKWKTSLIMGIVWEVVVVWCSIVAIKSDGIKPVIVSVKVKWLMVVG